MSLTNRPKLAAAKASEVLMTAAQTSEVSVSPLAWQTLEDLKLILLEKTA